MNRAQKVIAAVDRAQQGRRWLAFGVAVWKKFGDDQAGHLAALVAYYAFVSLFPLLLVFVTILDIVLAGHPGLRNQVANSAFGEFPVVGAELKSIHALPASGAALAVGLIVTFLGARGVAGATQNALNTVWGVPYSRRPGFPWSMLRSVTMIVVVGLGVIVTSLLSGIAAGTGHVLTGAGAHTVATIISLLLNIGLFWLGFRLATASEITSRELLPGALLAGMVWQILQSAGGYIVGHQIAHSSALYGVFAVALGLLAWLYLQAQFTLYAVEAAVVRARGLWPRSLAPPPFTPQDRRAYVLYAAAAQRRPEMDVSVRVKDSPAREEKAPVNGDTKGASSTGPDTSPERGSPASSNRDPKGG